MTVARNNLLGSPVICSGKYEVIESRGYRNVSLALNEGIRRATGDLICAVHQDVYLPSGWEAEFWEMLRRVEDVDPDWGVIGPAGGHPDEKDSVGYVNYAGRPCGHPARGVLEVDTVDELMLVIRRGDLEFDEEIPFAHFYGADACLQMRAQGRKTYVIDNYVHHNSTFDGRFPPEFYACEDYIRRKWQAFLPFTTTCAVVK
jgi:hypothetical protein